MFHSDVVRPDDERRFGVASQKLNELLRTAAERERNLHPDEPHIHCAVDGCGEWVKEGWFFCCEDHRNQAVRELTPR